MKYMQRKLALAALLAATALAAASAAQAQSSAGAAAGGQGDSARQVSASAALEYGTLAVRSPQVDPTAVEYALWQLRPKDRRPGAGGGAAAAPAPGRSSAGG